MDSAILMGGREFSVLVFTHVFTKNNAFELVFTNRKMSFSVLRAQSVQFISQHEDHKEFILLESYSFVRPYAFFHVVLQCFWLDAVYVKTATYLNHTQAYISKDVYNCSLASLGPSRNCSCPLSLHLSVLSKR